MFRGSSFLSSLRRERSIKKREKEGIKKKKIKRRTTKLTPSEIKQNKPILLALNLYETSSQFAFNHIVS